MKETEIAKVVVKYLQDLRWEIYQEVQVFQYGAVADIVAKQGPVIWVIETKTSLSLAVIGQAYEWTHWANYVSVAVPGEKKRIGFAAQVLKTYGIGLLRVNYYEYDWYSPVEERERPIFRRKVGKHILDALHESHKTYAEAGNSEGRHWSPFKQTCMEIRRYVSLNEGCTIKELVEKINYHYASVDSAKICIPKWASQGVIEGVRCENIEGKWRFYLEK